MPKEPRIKGKGLRRELVVVEDPVVKRDPKFDAFTRNLRSETAHIFKHSLTKTTLELGKFSTEFKAQTADTSIPWPTLVNTALERLLEVQDLLGKMSLCLTLGVPPAAESTATSKPVILQKLLGKELNVVWKMCANFGTVFASETFGELKVYIEKFPECGDFKTALASGQMTTRMFLHRYVARIHTMLLTLGSLLEKNSDKFEAAYSEDPEKHYEKMLSKKNTFM